MGVGQGWKDKKRYRRKAKRKNRHGRTEHREEQSVPEVSESKEIRW